MFGWFYYFYDIKQFYNVDIAHECDLRVEKMIQNSQIRTVTTG